MYSSYNKPYILRLYLLRISTVDFAPVTFYTFFTLLMLFSTSEVFKTFLCYDLITLLLNLDIFCIAVLFLRLALL
jgi:hypothetical protein